MVQINFAQKSVNVKIVYYGPGMSGKTTNLEVVHQRAPEQNRGDLTSISTDGDRTLFFDYMPLDLGTVAGMRTCFQVYTVPGQVYYNSTRKLVLQGVDGIIFVADSAPSMTEQNLESLRNLEENLNEYGKSLASLPHVIQYNKRDLPDALPVADLERDLNAYGAQIFEAVANTGQGVFPTLKALAALVLKTVLQEASGSSGGASKARPQAAPAAAQPAAVPTPTMAPARTMMPASPTPTGPASAAAAASAVRPAGAPPSLGVPAGELPGGVPGGAPAAATSNTPNPYDTPTPQQPAAASEPALAMAPKLARPESAQGVGGLMKTPKTQRPAARPKGRAHSVPRRPAAVPAKTPKASGGGAKTAVFVTVAAGVGAALAYAVLNLL